MPKRLDRIWIDPERFRRNRLSSGLSSEEAASELGVSERTVRNWESGRVPIPYAAFRLLRVLRGYKLPGEPWRGFTVKGDTLWTPENKPIYAWEMRWLSLTFGMARYWMQSYGHKKTIPAAALRDSLDPTQLLKRRQTQAASVSGRHRVMVPGDPKPTAIVIKFPAAATKKAKRA